LFHPVLIGNSAGPKYARGGYKNIYEIKPSISQSYHICTVFFLLQIESSIHSSSNFVFIFHWKLTKNLQIALLINLYVLHGPYITLHGRKPETAPRSTEIRQNVILF
jgi:hypothetical protein